MGLEMAYTDLNFYDIILRQINIAREHGHTRSHYMFLVIMHDFAPKISMEKSADLVSVPGLIYGRNLGEPRATVKYESNCVGGARNSIGTMFPR